MENNQDLIMWTAIVSFAIPPIVAVIQQPRWSKPARTIVATLVSVIAGLGTVYFTDAEVLSTVTPTVVLTVLIASMGAYKTFWRGVGVRELEQRTSPNDYTYQQREALEAAAHLED